MTSNTLSVYKPATSESIQSLTQSSLVPPALHPRRQRHVLVLLFLARTWDIRRINIVPPGLAHLARDVPLQHPLAVDRVHLVALRAAPHEPPRPGLLGQCRRLGRGRTVREFFVVARRAVVWVVWGHGGDDLPIPRAPTTSSRAGGSAGKI